MAVFEEKEGAIFKLLSEAISEGVIIVNAQQLIVAANRAANDMFGYAEEELVDKQLQRLIPREFSGNHGKHFEGYIKQPGKRQMGGGRELHGAKKCGSSFPVEVGLNPIKIGNKTFVMAIVLDITERKEYTKNLEETVEKRTAQLKEALLKEKELNELKTKFLSLVSHEFKTPLSGILSSANLLEKYTDTNQQDKREKHVKTIKSKVKYLDNILTDFLSVERLETGKVNYKFSDFPLSKVINEVVYDANMMLKDGQKINYPKDIDGINLNFDEKILELILTNLIGNSIKYSPENSTIDIEVTEETDLIIKIKDDGIGIPINEQKYIFNRYFRAENAVLNQGTGIGLNIVKSHLENLGGRITFISKENIGSTFTIRVPITNS